MLATALGGPADPVDQPRPALRVRSLEGVVVALDPGPDDEVRLELAREVDRVQRPGQRLAPRRLVRGDEASPAEARVEVQAGRDAVDVVAVECLPHLVEVLGREFLGVVELVAVDQVAEP